MAKNQELYAEIYKELNDKLNNVYNDAVKKTEDRYVMAHNQLVIIGVFNSDVEKAVIDKIEKVYNDIVSDGSMTTTGLANLLKNILDHHSMPPPPPSGSGSGTVVTGGNVKRGGGGLKDKFGYTHKELSNIIKNLAFHAYIGINLGKTTTALDDIVFKESEYWLKAEPALPYTISGTSPSSTTSTSLQNVTYVLNPNLNRIELRNNEGNVIATAVVKATDAMDIYNCNSMLNCIKQVNYLLVNDKLDYIKNDKDIFDTLKIEQQVGTAYTILKGLEWRIDTSTSNVIDYDVMMKVDTKLNDDIEKIPGTVEKDNVKNTIKKAVEIIQQNKDILKSQLDTKQVKHFTLPKSPVSNKRTVAGLENNKLTGFFPMAHGSFPSQWALSPFTVGLVGGNGDKTPFTTKLRREFENIQSTLHARNKALDNITALKFEKKFNEMGDIEKSINEFIARLKNFSSNSNISALISDTDIAQLDNNSKALVKKSLVISNGFNKINISLDDVTMSNSSNQYLKL